MYLDSAKIFLRLWRAYGGFSALFVSPYCHVSVIMTLISVASGEMKTVNELSLQIVPSIIGFSIGAYAIIFGIMSEKIVKALSLKSDGEEYSLLTILSSSFAWFIIVQAFCIVISSSISLFSVDRFVVYLQIETYRNIFMYFAYAWNMISAFFFFYALVLLFATTLEMFRISTFRDLE